MGERAFKEKYDPYPSFNTRQILFVLTELLSLNALISLLRLSGFVTSAFSQVVFIFTLYNASNHNDQLKVRKLSFPCFRF